MRAQLALAAALGLTVLVAAAALVAHKAYWRPVMPELVIDLRSPADREKPGQLILIYGEAGSDPFRSGTLAADQRVSACTMVSALCISEPARHGYRTEGTRRQSLQIRHLNGRGNPILGGLVWTGRSYPKRIKVVCDLGVAEPRNACAIEDVEV